MYYTASIIIEPTAMWGLEPPGYATAIARIQAQIALDLQSVVACAKTRLVTQHIQESTL